MDNESEVASRLRETTLAMINAFCAERATVWYLATPYSKYERGPDAAWADAMLGYAILNQCGVKCISPILHSHHLTKIGFAGDYAAWAAIDERLISSCDGIIVYMMPGWQQSEGINAEIEFAKANGKPVLYFPWSGAVQTQPIVDHLSRDEGTNA